MRSHLSVVAHTDGHATTVVLPGAGQVGVDLIGAVQCTGGQILRLAGGGGHVEILHEGPGGYFADAGLVEAHLYLLGIGVATRYRDTACGQLGGHTLPVEVFGEADAGAHLAFPDGVCG